jgi:hypothetical protein
VWMWVMVPTFRRHILPPYSASKCVRSVGRSGKLLLALASTVILGSGSCGTHEHIFLSHDSGSRETLSVLVG